MNETTYIGGVAKECDESLHTMITRVQLLHTNTQVSPDTKHSLFFHMHYNANTLESESLWRHLNTCHWD